MTQKTRIRICIVLVVIGLMGFSDCSFAEETGSEVKFLGYSLEFVLSALSRIWVFFAKIAGIFLTNKWVYGEVLGWDVLLRKFRNIVKNFANFGLGLYFMYIVFKGLINQVKGEDATKNLKDTILWLLIAGIGIQSSRFLTATIIDVSSITLAAAGSFPSQILSESEYTQDSLKKALKDSLGTGGKNISLFPKDAKESSMLKTSVFELETSKLEGTGSDMEKLIDAIMPNQNNVSGPLYFIGFSFLKTNVITSLNTSSEATIKSVILNMLIQSGTTIVFSIEMLMLCIIALMRIVYLWMFIVLSPIVVLLKCLEKMGDKDLLNTNVVKSLGKQISLKTFLVNTFKPTFIVLGMGIAVIFVSLMQGVITESAGKSVDIGGTEISSRKVSSSIVNMEAGDRRYTSSIDSNLLKFVAVNMGKTLLELILSIIVVIMVYFIVRQAMSLGGGDDFISKRISGISKSFESLVMKTPIVPISGYDENGVSKKSSISLKGLKDLPGRFIDENITQKITAYSATQEDEVMKMLGFGENQLSQEEKNKIKNAGKTNTGLKILEAKRDYINTIKTKEGKGMTLNPNAPDNFWIGEFEGWLDRMKDKTNQIDGDDTNDKEVRKSMINERNAEANKNNKSLRYVFNKVKGSVKAYANLFGLKGVEDWIDLIQKDISSSDDTISGGDNGTPASGGDNGTPASGGDNGTPASGGDNGTPASGGDNGTPASGGDNGTPASGGDNGTPASGGDNGTPASGGDNGTPASGGDNGTPASGGDNGTPASGGDNGTPASGGDNGTPASGGDNGTPASGGDNGTPATGGDNGTPASGGDNGTPASGGDNGTPASGGDNGTPATGGDNGTPASGGDN